MSSDQNSESGLLNNYWNSNEDILYFEKVGEQFRVFHEVGEGEWLWAQSCSTNEYGLLLAECVVRLVRNLFKFAFILCLLVKTKFCPDFCL